MPHELAQQHAHMLSSHFFLFLVSLQHHQWTCISPACFCPPTSHSSDQTDNTPFSHAVRPSSHHEQAFLQQRTNLHGHHPQATCTAVSPRQQSCCPHNLHAQITYSHSTNLECLEPLLACASLLCVMVTWFSLANVIFTAPATSSSSFLLHSRLTATADYTS